MALSEIYLSEYCSELLGEAVTRVVKVKTSKESKKKKHSKLKIDKIINTATTEKLDSIKITDDGFKICSEIPPDDSDVSDAFISDDENQKEFNAKDNYETEDGFKIIGEREIPSDDSDVSDAFESDLDESEWINEAEKSLTKKDKVPNLFSTSIENKSISNYKFQNVKKPLLDMIKDFGMEDKFCLKQSNNEANFINDSKKRKILNNNELNIMDYSRKRGKKKKNLNVECVKTETTKVTKSDRDAALKKTRYEVYKFGSIGAASDTMEKKNAKIKLVVKLGAKAPRNKAVNYKKLIEIRKENKTKEKIKREETRQMGLPVKKPEVKRKQKRDIDANPRIGKFKNGVLMLSKKDIASINS